MDNLGYINGGKVTVKIGGNAVGGIVSAVIRRKNDLIKIKEFLTDKPVYSLSVPSYLIELKSRTDIASLLEEKSLFGIAFESEGKCIEYSDCTLESADGSVLPDKPPEYRVIINAKNRSVEDV